MKFLKLSLKRKGSVTRHAALTEISCSAAQKINGGSGGGDGIQPRAQSIIFEKPDSVFGG
ncbi:hypothetical protein [Pseudoalteromonas sp. OOF1S-7]|uniref:hypothetical protein n=1 Tax=Pseudoalteromonas sp. OOF1S-7 TaxID=2917757 RepID=UPI001EF696C5|nr:hypothetical protein [Pseudoalteromonas sp. OOF1S-7]MCG7537201.1 hypothetical protein [Pseudoalteromonas sp. OOF1S-7]